MSKRKKYKREAAEFLVGTSNLDPRVKRFILKNPNKGVDMEMDEDERHKRMDELVAEIGAYDAEDEGGSCCPGCTGDPDDHPADHYREGVVT